MSTETELLSGETVSAIIVGVSSEKPYSYTVQVDDGFEVTISTEAPPLRYTAREKTRVLIRLTIPGNIDSVRFAKKQ